jgi:hypothetical protein
MAADNRRQSVKLFSTLTPLVMAAALLLPVRADRAEAALDKPQLKLIKAAVFEVVVRKPSEENMVYERPLPLDLLPFQERTDLYRSVGTAFAIGPQELVSAAHVLGLDHDSQYRDYYIRDAEGKVAPIDSVVRYSERRDLVTFTVTGRTFDRYLPVNPEPELDEKVYAVGNALGEGIVIRDGLFTSATPEELKGEWKWLRFSAAASPGNSGGPLLDEAGRVIGVILRKSPNENLNMALPIREVTAAGPARAHVFKKAYFKLDNMPLPLVDTLSWETDLPRPYGELRTAIVGAVESFTRQLHRRYLDEYRERIFPAGKESLALLNRHYHDNFPRLIVMGPDGTWDAQAPNQTGALQLGHNGQITLGVMQDTVLMQVRKPDDIPLATFYNDSRLFMDLFLKAIGATREIGIDKIRIVSLGRAENESEHTDRYGRRWQVRSWSSPYDNTRVVSVSLPVPGGCVVMLRSGPTGVAFTNLLDLKSLTDFVYLSYCGSLASWKEFLALKQYLPPALVAKEVSFAYGKELRYGSDRLTFTLDETNLRLTEKSELHLSFGYFLEEGKAVWDVKEIAVGEDDTTTTSYKLTRYTRPPGELNDSDKADWEKIVAGRMPFNRTSYIEENSTRIATVSPPMGDREERRRAEVLYRLGYRREGTHGQEEMAGALDAFVRRVTLREGPGQGGRREQ